MRTILDRIHPRRRIGLSAAIAKLDQKLFLVVVVFDLSFKRSSCIMPDAGFSATLALCPSRAMQIMQHSVSCTMEQPCFSWCRVLESRSCKNVRRTVRYGIMASYSGQNGRPVSGGLFHDTQRTCRCYQVMLRAGGQMREGSYIDCTPG